MKAAAFTPTSPHRWAIRMASYTSVYNRSAIVLLPVLSFGTCCVSLLIIGGGSLLDIAEITYFFGVKRSFLIMPAIIGLATGLLDWFLPSRKWLLISSAILSTIAALFFGWALSQSIIYF